ncbi:endo alpha-1,4 polygalactosaminidase [Pseudokineococcus basanitobsidens]|uniref:Endo alpha-1,4 polygalactosaminidase n=1 Tax=Pseudokineococcus basanitobsidens TaxID=1926649 RepID=A0ABU8RNM6_9ACTN
MQTHRWRRLALLLGASLVLACCSASPDAGAAARPRPATTGTATSGGDAARPTATGGAARTTATPVVTPPPVGARADYQLGGAYAPARGVGVVTRDRTEPPARGVYSVCYVNAFQTQPQEAAWWRRHHPDLLLRDGRGRTVEDEGWPGELLLDTRTAATRAGVAAVVGGWLDGCAAKGYRAVELDNLDSWLRSGGRLTTGGNLALAQLLARRAHARGLAVAQKNAPELTRSQVRTAGFDFAVAEECEVYDECDAYTAVHGRRVVEIEYTDNGRAAFRRACAERGGRVSVLLRDRDVVPRGEPGYVSQTC